MADTTIDSLQIEINAKAQKANDAIDVLVDKLDVLSNSLGKLDASKISNFASGINQLSSSVKNIASIDGRTFTALANNLTKIANINSSGIGGSANAISSVASAFNQLQSVNQASQYMATLVSSISKLGNKSVTNAIVNIPQLANSMNQLMVTLSKAPTVNQSVIDMTNALANLASQGSKVGSASKAVVNGLNRTNTAVKRTASNTMSLARAFGKFYANYFLLVRGFKGMFNMMESAMELTETVNYFEVTLRNIGESARESWKEYGYESADAYANSFSERLRESNEKLTGFTVSETGQISQSVFSGLGINPATATQYSAMFAQVANSIGMTEEASIALSEAFVRLGADWASLRNVDFDVAYEKLASGLAGQSRALRAFGVDITMATLQEIAFANGIEKSVSEMTQSEKAYLRLIAIIEQSEVAFGDLANTLASPANQMRMLSQGIQNLGTLIGNLFLPILSKTLPVLNGFVIALQRIVIAISESMGIDTSGFNTSLGGMDEGFGDLSDSVDEATESAEKFNRATRGWDELNVLGKDTSKGYGVGNDLVENEQLLDAYDDAIEKYRKAWNEAYENINNEAEDFADEFLKNINADKLVRDFNNLSESAKNIWEAFSPLLSGTTSGFGNTMFNSLKLLADFAGDITKNADPVVMEAVGESIGTIIASIMLYKGVSSITTSFINGIKGIGLALSAHPILSKFVLAAGIITLLTLPIRIDNKKKQEETERKFADIIEGIEYVGEKTTELKQKGEEAKRTLDEAQASINTLQRAFEDWESLSSKPVEFLTEQEVLLLELYTDRLTEVLPQAKDIIEDQSLSYEDVINKVRELMDVEKLRLKQQSYEDYLSLSYDAEVQLEFNLDEAEKKVEESLDEFAKNFPGLPKGIVEKVLLQSIGEEVDGVWGRMGEIRYMEGGEEKVYRYDSEKSKQASYDTQVYVDAIKELEEAQIQLNKQREETQWALEKVAEAQSAYAEATKKSAERNKEFLDSFGDSESILGKFREALAKIGVSYEDLYRKGKDSLQKLSKEIQNFKVSDIVVPEITLPSTSIVSQSPNYNSNGIKSSAVADLLNRSILNSQMQTDVNVTFDVKGDPNGIFKVVQQEAQKYTYQTGKPPLR